MLVLNRKSPDPLYHQIASYYKAKIISGELESGAKLPPIELLTKQLDCGKITVVNAYKKLVTEGYISVRKSKGYTVCRTPQKAITQIKASISRLMLEARRNGCTSEDVRDIIAIVKGTGG